MKSKLKTVLIVAACLIGWLLFALLAGIASYESSSGQQTQTPYKPRFHTTWGYTPDGPVYYYSYY